MPKYAQTGAFNTRFSEPNDVITSKKPCKIAGFHESGAYFWWIIMRLKFVQGTHYMCGLFQELAQYIVV